MSAKTLLSNQTTTISLGNITTLNSACHRFTVLIYIDSNLLSALSIDLYGSIDSTHLQSVLGSSGTAAPYVLSATELVQGFAMFHVVDKPLRHIAASIPVMTGTGSVTVLIEALGDDEKVI